MSMIFLSLSKSFFRDVNIPFGTINLIQKIHFHLAVNKIRCCLLQNAKCIAYIQICISFLVLGKNVVKRACTNSGCGPTCYSSYCMNHGDYYQINVECWHSSYYLGYGNVATTFYVYATDNSPPSIWLQGK